MKEPIHILVTLDRGYLRQLLVMLTSLTTSDPHSRFEVHVMNSSLSEGDLHYLRGRLRPGSCGVHDIKISDGMLAGAPVEERYPREMYYRLFAAQFLPAEIPRVIYLDPDLVVLGSLRPLWEMEMGESFFAACSHLHRTFRRLNELRLDLPHESAYANSGVLLMNLDALRQQQDIGEVLRYIGENRQKLLLPDQDVINVLYGKRIIELNSLVFNLSDRYYRFYNLNPQNVRVDLEWVRKNTVIVHYCGRNKPWKPGYHGKLGVFYQEFELRTPV